MIEKNKVLEFGSVASVVIRPRKDMTVGGKTYLAGEPYLYLKNVEVMITYTNTDKTAKTNVTLAAHSKLTPRSITISSVPLSLKILSLIAKYNGPQEFSYTKFIDGVASANFIFLTDSVDNTRPIYVYDSNYNKIEFTYNSEMNAVESGDFVDNQRYMISFSSVKDGIKYNLNEEWFSYFSIEIQGVGNIDKITKNLYLFIEKASFISDMKFLFNKTEMVALPLRFHIIDNSNNLFFLEE